MPGILNIFFIVIDIYKSAEEFGDIWALLSIVAEEHNGRQEHFRDPIQLRL